MPQEFTTYLQYKCRRLRPAIRILLLGGTAMLMFTMVLGDRTDPPSIPMGIRLLPLLAMGILSAITWRPISDNALQLATLGHTIAMYAGLLIDDVSRHNGLLFAAPTLIVAGVASSMIWVNGALLFTGEALTASTMIIVLVRSDIPAWLQIHAAIFMALSIAAGCLLYLVTSRFIYDNFRLEEQLRRSAFTDELTGLANRRRIMQMAKRLFRRCQTEGQPLGVLYVDADHFKKINDDFGHEKGDKVLCHPAHTIEEVIRPTDQAGRIGGEEFIVLLPGATQDDAIDIAERIRKTVEASRMEDLAITVSIGVATAVEGYDFRMAMNAADAKVLMAKRNGRNRVEVAQLVSLETSADDAETRRHRVFSPKITSSGVYALAHQ